MKITLALILVLISFESFSCDVCGGVVSPGTQGLLPTKQFHFIGTRFRYDHFTSNTNYSGVSRSSTEHFLRASLYGRWQFASKFDLQAEVPFAYNLQEEEDSTRSHTGLGDISVVCNYELINNKNEAKETSHILRSGVGMKLPTGYYSKDAWETNNLFPGTGSFDLVLSTNYVFTKKKLGLLNEFSFLFPTENKAGYKRGESLIARMNGFYKIQLSNWQFLPALGASYIFSNTDKIYNIPVTQTFNNGQSINSELSLNLISNKWMLNAKYSYPIYQNINDGEVESKGTAQLGIYYLFQKK